MSADICYAVTVADVNGDQKPDVVAVTEDAVVWYENPSWRKQTSSEKRPPAITFASSLTTSTATAGSTSRSGPAGSRRIPRTRARFSGWAATPRAAGRFIPFISRSRPCIACAGAT